jgi:hypothetical protein
MMSFNERKWEQERISKLTRKEMLVIAKKYGIKGWSNLTKEEMVMKIVEIEIERAHPIIDLSRENLRKIGKRAILESIKDNVFSYRVMGWITEKDLLEHVPREYRKAIKNDPHVLAGIYIKGRGEKGETTYIHDNLDSFLIASDGDWSIAFGMANLQDNREYIEE